MGQLPKAAKPTVRLQYIYTKSNKVDKGKVTIVVSDADFNKLVQGKQKAQNLFMQGKLKIRGDIMKATRLDPILQKAQTKAKL